MKVVLDKIASSTRIAKLSREVTLTDDIVAREGYVLAGRVCGKKAVYNTLENEHGRMVQIDDGDAIAGVLGERRALRGYAGVVPPAIKKGDRLSILSLGGVIGQCTSVNIDVGEPFGFEVLGAVLAFPYLGERVGVPANVKEGAIARREHLTECAPVIAVAGTCMNSGKTLAASECIRQLARAGYRIAAAKLTGVSLLRDCLSMLDCGAFKVLDFADAGSVSTNPAESVGVAKGLLAELTKERPDAIVVELGDGIMGEYGVQSILADEEIMRAVRVHIVCAGDPVGAWGAAELYKNRFKLPIAAIAGPATDNKVGKDFIRRELGIEAWNARVEPEKLAARVRDVLAVTPTGANASQRAATSRPA